MFENLYFLAQRGARLQTQSAFPLERTSLSLNEFLSSLRTSLGTHPAIKKYGSRLPVHITVFHRDCFYDQILRRLRSG
jgi:hypothetical protein